MDIQHLNDLSLHGALEGEVCSGRSYSDSKNILAYPLAGLFIFATSPSVIDFEEDMPLGDYSLSIFTPFSYSNNLRLLINPLITSFS